MDRRKVLKISGKAIGTAILSPAILAVLQSCREEKKPIDWEPSVLTDQQAYLLTLLSDVIIPPTSTPSASETNTPYFIDRLMHEVLQEDQVDQIKYVLDHTDDFSNEKMKFLFSKARPEHRYEFLIQVDDQAYGLAEEDRKSTRLNSSHVAISYAVFCLKKKKNTKTKYQP